MAWIGLRATNKGRKSCIPKKEDIDRHFQGFNDFRGVTGSVGPGTADSMDVDNSKEIEMVNPIWR